MIDMLYVVCVLWVVVLVEVVVYVVEDGVFGVCDMRVGSV